MPRPETAPSTGRFKRQTEWPADSEQLWRCEIKWHAGYANSDFRAVAHRPDRHRGVTLGRSETFKWLLKGDPEESDAEFVGQVRGSPTGSPRPAGSRSAGGPLVRAALRVAAGGRAPEQLDPAPAKASR